jgi:hypothetical protein
MTHHEAVETMAAERYLLDEMSDADRQTFEEHYFSCTDCATDLQTTAAMLEGAREGFAKPAVSKVRSIDAARRPRPAWHRSVALPWAVAATLAIVAGYESLRPVSSPARTESPFALAPVTLRPESRGSEAVVHIPRDGSPVSLAVEINEAPQGGELTYDLSRANGERIVSGRAPSPASGSPLLLLMPAWTVAAPMHYILSVHDAAGDRRLLGEYRFAAAP